MGNAWVFAAHAQADPNAETESRRQQRYAGKLRSKKIQSGAHIALLARAAIVYAGAESCAAKIKSHNRNAKSIQGLRRLVNHFIVHCAAKKRMRGAHGCPKNRLELSCRSFQKKIARLVSVGHGYPGTNLQCNASLQKDRIPIVMLAVVPCGYQYCRGVRHCWRPPATQRNLQNLVLGQKCLIFALQLTGPDVSFAPSSTAPGGLDG